MAWGSPAVTRRRIQADNSIPYSTGNAGISIQHVGMIRRLLLRLNAQEAYTKSSGGSTQDAQGPFNLINWVNLRVNGIGTFLDTSFWGLYLYNLIHFANTGFDPSSSDNTGVAQTTTATSVFNFPAVPGATGNITGVLAQLFFPFTIELAGIKEVGLFVMQNDEINLVLTPQWNSIGASATPLQAPYDIAGGDSFAITAANTNLDVVRDFYAVPASKGDYPVVGWFHQIEQTRVSMTSNQTEIAHPKGGIILRAIYQCVDGTGPALMANSSISRLQWLYGSNETPYDESITDVLIRQRNSYGHDLPKGVMVHDFFGRGRMLTDTFDTAKYQNLRTRITTPSTPNAGSYVDVIRERLIPIGNVAESLY